MGLRNFHLAVGGQALAASLAWPSASFSVAGAVPPLPLTLPDISGLLWDSGEDPALGTTVPGTVSVNLANAEIIIVARGHGECPLDLGNGSQALFYGADVNDASTGDVYFYDGGGFRTLISNSFLPQLAPTIIGYRGNGSGSLRAQVNGVFGAGVGAGTATVTGGKVGQRVTGGSTWSGDVHRVLIYNANLGTSDRADLYAYLREHYGMAAYTKQVLCAGDSLTAGYHPDDNFAINGWTAPDVTHSYPYEMAQDYPAWKVLNHGISAIQVSTMLTNDDDALDPYYDATNFAQNVLVFWAGTNDFAVGGASLATVQSRCSSYFAARKAAGFTVVAIQMMDRSDFTSGQRADKDSYNTWLAGLVGTDIDALVTLPTGLAGNSPWTSYSSHWSFDNTHLSRVGYQALAAAVGPVVAAL